MGNLQSLVKPLQKLPVDFKDVSPMTFRKAAWMLSRLKNPEFSTRPKCIRLIYMCSSTIRGHEMKAGLEFELNVFTDYRTIKNYLQFHLTSSNCSFTHFKSFQPQRQHFHKKHKKSQPPIMAPLSSTRSATRDSSTSARLRSKRRRVQRSSLRAAYRWSQLDPCRICPRRCRYTPKGRAEKMLAGAVFLGNVKECQRHPKGGKIGKKGES